MTEARLVRNEGGWLEPEGEGWYVLNATDAKWLSNELGWYCNFEGAERFPEFGFNINVLPPGKPMAMYHREPHQEGFYVLDGEAILIVDGEERRLKQWDYVHCERDVPHVIVGAGDGALVARGREPRRARAARRTPSTRQPSSTARASRSRRATRVRPTRGSTSSSRRRTRKGCCRSEQLACLERSRRAVVRRRALRVLRGLSGGAGVHRVRLQHRHGLTRPARRALSPRSAPGVLLHAARRGAPHRRGRERAAQALGLLPLPGRRRAHRRRRRRRARASSSPSAVASARPTRSIR